MALRKINQHCNYYKINKGFIGNFLDISILLISKKLGIKNTYSDNYTWD